VPVNTTGMTGETAFVGLAGGAFHTCGLTAQGSAWCWGYDDGGQLGDGGAPADAYSPVPVDVSGMTGETAFVQISGGGHHTCGRTASGEAWCWGGDGEGQLGNGAGVTGSQVPIPVNVSGMYGTTVFVELITGDMHTCGVVASGLAWCWGQNLYKQLGDGSSTLNAHLPVPVESPP